LNISLKLPSFKLSPVMRISVGLISLLMGWIMLLDLLVGFWPDTAKTMLELREKTSENLAIQSAVHIQSRDFNGLKKTLEDAVHHNDQILSVAIRHKSGSIVLQVGDHMAHWKPVDSKNSTADFVRLGITASDQPWGELEIAYQPSSPGTISGWIRQPAVMSFGLLLLGGLVLYIFYLRGVFSYLDPSSVIPDRVRVAFDAFSEGVMMVDSTGRVMIANKMFRSWGEGMDGELFGKHAKELSVVSGALGPDPKSYPWTKAMEALQSINGWPVKIALPSGESIKVIVNCSVIQDAGSVRGCLVTFDDVTELDKLNQNLSSAMEKLKKSQAEIEEKNEELYRLATRDPMTGAFNRRSFFAEAEKILEEHRASKRPLCAIMSDIDHFKRFNDIHGHAIGDKVIIAFAKSLGVGLRTEDKLCRYGGEEFVILLPGAEPAVAMAIAERLRQEVEQRAGPSIRHTVPLNITSSFGVAQLEDDVVDLTMLIDRADQGLYVAKKSGRNRVKFYGEPIEENAPPELPRDIH
jgi:diguanylate cyclase (GGDEF)-like protein